MDFIGYINGISKDFETNRYNISIRIDDECETVLSAIQNGYTQNQKLSVHIAKYRKHRSLDANGYMWALLTQIANHKDIRSSKEEIYEQMLQRYGTLKYNSDGLSKIQLPEKAEIKDKPGHWLFNRKVRMFDEFGRPLDFNEYIEIKGSSEYDTEEMAVLLDGIISECKELGIETVTDYDYQLMLEDWGEQYAKAHKCNNK